ncbi:hypothetical protein SLEP1_g24289 [Rubroshorea leprosula]|uniref:Uncharacterized protein n=1 Tax=Rubroshorea leprosula TaxID=152421 RepID=A0AAV5JFF5_9ROSI|nr:hypothetical protein SLEP1_g24289 [Rubroshorea leprosula]
MKSESFFCGRRFCVLHLLGFLANPPRRWVPCKPRRWVRKEPKCARFTRTLAWVRVPCELRTQHLGSRSLRTQALGSQGTQSCWVCKEPKRAGFARTLAWVRVPCELQTQRLGSQGTQACWVRKEPKRVGFARNPSVLGSQGRLPGLTPNLACLGSVEPSTLGFGSLRTQRLGSQGTQVCWVRKEPKRAGFLQTQHGWVPCEPRQGKAVAGFLCRCWVRFFNSNLPVARLLQVLGSKSNLAGGGFHFKPSGC